MEPVNSVITATGDVLLDPVNTPLEIDGQYYIVTEIEQQNPIANLNELCRLCAKSAVSLVPIFQEGEPNLCQIINKYLPIVVS